MLPEEDVLEELNNPCCGVPSVPFKVVPSLAVWSQHDQNVQKGTGIQFYQGSFVLKFNNCRHAVQEHKRLFVLGFKKCWHCWST